MMITTGLKMQRWHPKALHFSWWICTSKIRHCRWLKGCLRMALNRVKKSKRDTYMGPIMLELNIFGCSHKNNVRQRSGPTSRKRDWMVLVDCCVSCGHLTAIHEVTYRQYRWIIRYNLGLKRFVLKKSREANKNNKPKEYWIPVGTTYTTARQDDTTGCYLWA